MEYNDIMRYLTRDTTCISKKAQIHSRCMQVDGLYHPCPLHWHHKIHLLDQPLSLAFGQLRWTGSTFRGRQDVGEWKTHFHSKCLNKNVHSTVSLTNCPLKYYSVHVEIKAVAHIHKWTSADLQPGDLSWSQFPTGWCFHLKALLRDHWSFQPSIKRWVERSGDTSKESESCSGVRVTQSCCRTRVWRRSSSGG